MPRSPNPTAGTSRRDFCSGATALLLAPSGFLHAVAQQVSPPATPTRPDVAAIDHDRILTAAARYLTQAPKPLTAIQCPRSPGTVHDYYSEAAPESDADAPSLFTAHRDALFELGLAVPALAAAHLLTGDGRYAKHAAEHLSAWFVDPATRMTPSLNFGSVIVQPSPPPSADDSPRFTVQTNPSFAAVPTAPAGTGRFQGILETLPLAEVAQAIPFLEASGDLSDADLKWLRAWFQAYLHWLIDPQDSGPRLAALARDRKDHHGTSWLLQASAYAAFTASGGDAPTSENAVLAELRHRFKSVTLRAQMSSDGTFPHELSSENPYRDSLFNLDLFAGVCALLSNRFESVWDYSLEDGPGMRSAIAYHFPYMADRSHWPFRSDRTHFTELPARRASLLLSARAYQRPEYATLWKMLPPDPPALDVLRTLPIHQPLLWVRQPPRPA